MAARGYRKFDLLFESKGGDNYEAIVDSAFGQGREPFVLPFSMDEIDAVRARLHSLGASSTARSVLPAPVPVGSFADPEIQRFGQSLFEAVFKGKIRDRYLQTKALPGGAVGLRIRIALNGAPALARLPWEYLYDPDGFFVALAQETSLVRRLETAGSDETLPMQPPVRVLVVVASPTGYPALRVDDEVRNLRGSLVELSQTGEVELNDLKQASIGQLRNRLREWNAHVLHFIGHGARAGADTPSAVAMVNAETGQAEHISAIELRQAVAETAGSLRLVVLNSCESAEAHVTDAFSGLAQNLVVAGVPIVIAMQYPITDGAAVAFSKELYTALAASVDVEAAVAAARQAIRESRPRSIEWGTPVIYMRGQDSAVLHVEPLSSETRLHNRIRALWTAVRADEAVRNYESAVQHLTTILELSAAEQDRVEPELTRFGNLQHAAQLYDRAKALVEAGDDPGAARVFERLFQLVQNHKDAVTLQGQVLERLSQRRLAERESAPPAAPRASSPGSLESHAEDVLDELELGRLAVFIGADANLCGRLAGVDWQTGNRAPSARELATYLANKRAYPQADNEDLDLMRVAQYVEARHRWGPLLSDVRLVLEPEFEPTPLHHLLGRLPDLLKPEVATGPLIVVSANYDDVLERTFGRMEKPFDLVTCQLHEGQLDQKSLIHQPHGALPRPIKIPNAYDKLPLTGTTTIIVKVRGPFERPAPPEDSFLLTEDQHLDYSASIRNLIPNSLRQALRKRSFLFLGYSLRDWHLRVFLNAVWPRSTSREYPCWVVLTEPRPINQTLWSGRHADIVDVGLDQFVDALTVAAAARS